MAYVSVKSTKCLYLAMLVNSSEVRLWESTWSLLLQVSPSLAGQLMNGDQKSDLEKEKKQQLPQEIKKKNPCRNNSAIVFWQLSWEVLIGRTKGCDFLVGYFLLCCMRVVFLTAQEQSSSLGTEWWLALTRAYKRYCRGTTSPSLGYWALLGAVRDQNNPSRYLGWRMGHLQQSRGRRAVAFDR